MNEEVFKYAQVGDYVWSPAHGSGEVISVDNPSDHPIYCEFSNIILAYMRCGRLDPKDKYPSLFYEKQSISIVSKRPKPEVDWSKVPRDTPVIVKYRAGSNEQELLFFAYLPEAFNKYVAVMKGRTAQTANFIAQYNSCKINENKVTIKKEWLK